jgi:hypothetical protein
MNIVIPVYEDFNTGISKRMLVAKGEYKCYTVDGNEVRNTSKEAEEFGLASSHPYFPELIPKDEIWIETNDNASEVNDLIEKEIYKLKLIDSGMDKWDAYHKAEEYKDTRYVYGVVTPDVYYKWYCDIGKGVRVWLVNADVVRKKFDADFMEGGNSAVYKWIPDNEIWVDRTLSSEEVPLIVLHEFVESVHMRRDKLSYDDAHDLASSEEWKRRNGDFTIKDLIEIKEEDVIKK